MLTDNKMLHITYNCLWFVTFYWQITGLFTFEW